MGESASSRDDGVMKCLSCGSGDTELRYLGSCFHNSDARYIRCGGCKDEFFFGDYNNSSARNLEQIRQQRPRVLKPSTDASFNSSSDVELGPSRPADSCSSSLTIDEQRYVETTIPKPLSGDAEISFCMSYDVPPSSRNKRQRSCSYLNGQIDRTENVVLGRSVSLSSIAEDSVDADMMEALVLHLTDTLRQQPCNVCERRQWKRVEGINNIFRCSYCDNVIGFDNLYSYYELLPFLETGDYHVKPCRFCKNDDAAMFTLEKTGEQAEIKCSRCLRFQHEIEEMTVSEKDNAKDDDKKAQSTGVPSKRVRCRGRTEVKHLSLLRRGDHIAWHQPLAYWHHALIEEVAEDWLHVIHYNGPLSTKIKGIIMDEWIETNRDYLRSNNLYRWDYDTEDCLPADEVMKRAKSRLDEASYDLLGNNCEHFASWCKTGIEYSSQVANFKDTVHRHDNNWRIAAAASKFLAKAFGRSHDVKKAVNIGGKAVNIGLNVTSAGKDVGNAVSKMAVKEVKHVASALNFIETGIVLVLEVGAVYRDIQRARSQRLAGEITRNEFLRVTIKRTSEGVGCAAGAAVVLALPLPAKWIGCTLATLIGQGAGALVGRKLADFV